MPPTPEDPLELPPVLVVHATNAKTNGRTRKPGRMRAIMGAIVTGAPARRQGTPATFWRWGVVLVYIARRVHPTYCRTVP